MFKRFIRTIATIATIATGLTGMASAQVAHVSNPTSCPAGQNLVVIAGTPTCQRAPNTVKTVRVHGQGDIPLSEFDNLFAVLAAVQVTKSSITALEADAPAGYLYWNSRDLSVAAMMPDANFTAGSTRCISSPAGGVTVSASVCGITATNVTEIRYLDAAGAPVTILVSAPSFGGQPENPNNWWILTPLN